MDTAALAPRIRVSLDGQWLAWRPDGDTSGTWTMIPLAGGQAQATVTDAAVQHWQPMIAADPLLAAWAAEISFCIGDQPIEACSECMGLTLAINAVRNAAQL